MKYYKVRMKYDQIRYWKKRKSHHALFFGGFLIGNELYTEKELERLTKVHFERYTPISEIFEPVEISRKRIFWSFGARFYDYNNELKEAKKVLKEGGKN